MRELHMPDGKPVVINPEAVAFLHPLGADTTIIGFGGGGSITVQGGYEDILIDLGLIDHETPAAAHDDEEDDFEHALEPAEDEPAQTDESRVSSRSLLI